MYNWLLEIKVQIYESLLLQIKVSFVISFKLQIKLYPQMD